MNPIKLSKRVQKLAPSATLGMAAKAAALRAQGANVISFATGEPDFDTPANIKEAAKKSIDRGDTKYAPSAGIPKLREAISKKMKRDNGLDYAPEEITVSCGAKQAIANALLATVDEGDDVIVPAPYWVSYPAQVKLAGGNPIILDTTANRMKLTPDQLANACSGKARAIILNSPSNPTGAVYTSDELKAIAKVCREKDIVVISDEIYEHIVYDDAKHVSILNADESLRDNTIIVNGVSKSFSMTGWRLGWAAGPKEVITKMNQLAGQQTTSPTTFVQHAAAAALEGSFEDVKHMCAAFAERRNRICAMLNEINGIEVERPAGTFYVFANMQSFIGKRFGNTAIPDDLALAELLLTEGHIATVAGTPFGAPGFIRFSFATSIENIEEGVARLRDVLTKLTN
jgi:aspartate aminotransferase